MAQAFNPILLNDVFSDPGLFIPFRFRKRALIFDLGDLHALSIKDLLKISHVFVTHTHMDHFIGFDTLLRLFLGRDKELHLFGPAGFFQQVEGRLAGYTWNLVDEFQEHLRLRVTEVHAQKTSTKLYLCQERFNPENPVVEAPFDGLLLQEPGFHVQATLLDHRIPCLGLALTEHFSINIIKEQVQALGLPIGPWLNRFKNALYEKQDPDMPFTVTWKGDLEEKQERNYRLGELAGLIAKVSLGQKIAYITDIIADQQNREKVLELAQDADQLFIEAAFLDCDRDMAHKKYHLTAREAGEWARLARVKHVTPFHFSPRYSDCAEAVEAEVQQAFCQT